MTWPVSRRRVRDTLEWRNDRTERHLLWLIYERDVDRSQVALAVYEAQQKRQPKPDREGRDGR
jgi:hypothetical protein